MEAVTELLVRKGREEAEGGIRRPVETNAILSARHLRPEHGLSAERPRDGVARLAERLRVRLRAVATDGHRLAFSTRSLGKAIPSATGIVPRKAVTEIMRVLGASEEVQLAITENQFVLQMPNFVMTARLIEGQFPNYDAVIPRTHPGKLAAPRSSLSAALRRVAVMAEERNKPVKLDLSPASLKVTASSQELWEAEEILDVEYAGEEMVIGFNSRYLLEAMAALDKDQVVFEIKDAQSPGVIKSGEDEGYCCVIMPMRI